MSRSNLTDVLDICLKRVESGNTIDEVLTAYPEQAGELRELLQVALTVMPSSKPVRIPASAQVDSRSRLLAQAQALRQQRKTVGWQVLSFLRLNLASVAFATAAILLLFMALGSVKALPGDSLYPVKLAAEQAGISLSSSPNNRDVLEANYDSRRAEEVMRMIQMKRTGAVSFGGFLNRAKTANGWQIDQIPLLLSPANEKQAQALTGAYIEVKGTLDNQGKVVVNTFQPRLESIQGTLTRLEPGQWIINGQTIQINQATLITGTPQLNAQVKLQGARLQNGSAILAITAEIIREEPSPALTASSTPPATETMPAPVVPPEPTQQETPQESLQPTAEPTETAAPQDQHPPEQDGGSHTQSTATAEPQSEHHSGDSTGGSSDGTNHPTDGGSSGGQEDSSGHSSD